MSKSNIKELSRELGKKTNLKLAFIADIDAEIQDFLDANNTADIFELYKEFSTPSDISGQFIGKAYLSELKKKAHKYFYSSYWGICFGSYHGVLYYKCSRQSPKKLV